MSRKSGAKGSSKCSKGGVKCLVVDESEGGSRGRAVGENSDEEEVVVLTDNDNLKSPSRPAICPYPFPSVKPLASPPDPPGIVYPADPAVIARNAEIAMEASGSRRNLLSEHSSKSELTSLLRLHDLEDVETLNSTVKTGQCQFSSMVPFLTSSAVTTRGRLDLVLRQMAVAQIYNDRMRYSNFLLLPTERTRMDKKRKVTLREYCDKMSDPSVDGDHITLQALSDLLDVKVNILSVRAGVSLVCSTIHPNRCRGPGGDYDVFRENLKGTTIWLGHVGDAHYRQIRKILSSGSSSSSSSSSNSSGIDRGLLDVPDDICNICLEEFGGEVEEVRLNSCKHRFCQR